MNGPVSPLAAIFTLQGRHGIFHMSVGQILQCVQIAAAVGAVPKLPRDWATANIHRSCRLSVKRAAIWRVDPELVVPLEPDLTPPKRKRRKKWIPESDPQPLVNIAGIISLDDFGFCGGEYAFGLDTINGTETVGLQVILKMLQLCEQQAYITALPIQSWWWRVFRRYCCTMDPSGDFLKPQIIPEAKTVVFKGKNDAHIPSFFPVGVEHSHLIGLVESSGPDSRKPSCAKVYVPKYQFRLSKQDKQPESAITLSILRALRKNFDRIVRILRRDIEIEITERLAGNMLNAYLEAQGYLYRGSILSNTPWMLAYMAGTQCLLGEPIIHHYEALAQAISNSTLQVAVNKKKQIYAIADQPASLTCDFSKHRFYEDFRGQSMLMQIKSGSAGLIYKQEIIFYSASILDLLNAPRGYDRRDQKLLTLADQIFIKHKIDV